MQTIFSKRDKPSALCCFLIKEKGACAVILDHHNSTQSREIGIDCHNLYPKYIVRDGQCPLQHDIGTALFIGPQPSIVLLHFANRLFSMDRIRMRVCSGSHTMLLLYVLSLFFGLSLFVNSRSYVGMQIVLL